MCIEKCRYTQILREKLMCSITRIFAMAKDYEIYFAVVLKLNKITKM